MSGSLKPKLWWRAIPLIFTRGVFVLVAASFLAGCGWVPTILNQSLDAATTIAEHRSFYNTAEDYATRSEITSSFFDENLLLDVSTDVYKGRVMLTGAVKNAAARRRAEELARQASGTGEVFNEIQITPDGRIQAAAEGLIIEAKLKAKLMSAAGVRSINYRWRAINGVVYLLGTAGNPEELSRVVTIAQETQGVRGVVSHVMEAREDVIVATHGGHGRTRGQVVSVHDAESITVLLGRTREKVRLIGSDAPDSGRYSGRKQAREFLTRLVHGKTVSLETDTARRDHQRRLLAYVYVGDLFVNLELIRQGQTVMYTRPPNVKHAIAYGKAQQEAREAGRGVWQQTASSDRIARPSPRRDGNVETSESAAFFS